MPPDKKKRRKGGKYAPLVWIVTGALIAFFISYSGSLKQIVFPAKNEKQNQSNTNSFNLSQLFGSKKSSLSVPVSSSSSSTGEAVSSSQGNETVKIYLALQSGNEITLVSRDVQINRGPSLLRDSIQQLINYRKDDLLNLVPINTKVRKIWIKNDVAYIDFTEDFSYNSYGLTGYKIQLYQIVYTATQFPNVKAVYFYMEGKPMEYLGGDGYIIHNPIYPFSSLPRFPI